jgi:hypothetical protein
MLTSARLREAIETYQASGGTAGWVEIIAHPDQEAAIRALPEFAAYLRPLGAADGRKAASWANGRAIGQVAGHEVWIDADCPPGSLYVLPPLSLVAGEEIAACDVCTIRSDDGLVYRCRASDLPCGAPGRRFVRGERVWFVEWLRHVA